MQNFTFNNTTKIIFGKGTENQVGTEVKQYKKVLLHYGEGSIKRSGLYDRVVKSLQQTGVDFIELGGVKPNPVLSLVHEGIRLSREHGVDMILAVGGGSAIDSAKAIAAGALYPGEVWDFFEDKASVKAALPVGVILTIAAAGSESSDGAVITKEEGQLKRAFGGSVLYPKFAILNPELTVTLSAYQTACGIADINAHIFERYFTRTPQVDFTDRMCEATLQTMILFGPRAIANPTDYEARAELMWAGAIAHNGLLGTGREEDWASHMIEHEISGIYDIAHGAGLATVFPAWMQYVYKGDLQRFVQFAVRVWDVDQSYTQPERIALEGIARTKAFFKDICLPVSLREMNIGADRLEEMAGKATWNGPLGSFKKLDKDDVFGILKLAL
jgi:alcohol dehydrogenase YqhD (iron-dependent ADH family)